MAPAELFSVSPGSEPLTIENVYEGTPPVATSAELDAKLPLEQVLGWMERETGIEPATSSLGSWRSTAELLPPLDLSKSNTG